MEKQTFPSCWSKDKAARRAERTIFTILYIFGREGWVILVFRFHFDQNSVDVLGSLPADVLWGSFVTHLLNAWRTNPKGPLRGGYVLGRRNWKVMSISVSSLATKESRIISQLPVTLQRVFFFLEIADYVLKKTCVSTSQKVMEKQTLLLWFATALLLLLSSKESSGSFFSSLQFTRDSLMSFSSGSERTVQILTPKKTTKTVMKKVPGVRPTKAKKKTKVTKYSVIHKSGWGAGPKRAPRTEPPPTKLVPVTETVVTYQNKRKVYRRRSSPSNKFLEAINDIERAVANAKASGIRFSARTLNKLKALVERAIRSKSYKYARQVRL